jgi:biopolymer transport protein ExbD
VTLKLPRPKHRRPAENTIALINIVFLMLIFFLVAGTLSPPLDPTVSMIGTEDAARAEPPDALSVTAEGTLRYRGRETTLEAHLAAHPAEDGAPFRLVVDRDLPATDLVGLTGDLRAAGIETVTVVTERAAP